MIRAKQAEYGVSFICRQLNVSRSGYYAWEKRAVSKHDAKDAMLVEKIKESHRSSRGTYGSPRIYDDLKEHGVSVGRQRIARLMRDNGITACPLKKYRRTTDSKHDLPIAPNLLNRNFKAARPNEVWVGDITYLWTGSGFVYLAVIVDLFSRRVVGWALKDNMCSELVLKALEAACCHRSISPGLIFHSDRGSQYASKAYREKLSALGIEASMSRKGDCWDNAVAESFFATIKRELVRKCYWSNWKSARTAVHEYIEVFYNRKRKHSTNGNLSPVEYERRFNNHAVVAA